MDKVEHVRADKDRADFLEVAVIFVLDFCYSPRVLSAFDDATITSLNILLGSNDGEWHSSHQAARMLSGSLIILLYGWLVDFDALSFNDGTNLR
jgi:hypothetical protein